MDDSEFSERQEEDQEEIIREIKVKLSEVKQETLEEVKNKVDLADVRLYETEFSSANMYIRHLVFMNGGALVAILSAKAGLISKNANNVDWTFWPMVFFAAGLILAVILNGIIYLSARKFSEKLTDITDSAEEYFDNVDEYVESLTENIDDLKENIHGLKENFVRIGKNFRENSNLSKFIKLVSLREQAHIWVGIAGLVSFILGAISGIYQLYWIP